MGLLSSLMARYAAHDVGDEFGIDRVLLSDARTLAAR
jgi:hypothetical protein